MLPGMRHQRKTPSIILCGSPLALADAMMLDRRVIADAALDALEGIDQPRANAIATAVRKRAAATAPAPCAGRAGIG
jgi:hypothetical protein